MKRVEGPVVSEAVQGRSPSLPRKWLGLWTVLMLQSLTGQVALADMLIGTNAANRILRYDDSGVFLGVAASGGGLNIPRAFAYGPGGDLYVASHNTGQVLQYDGQSGAFEGSFTSGGGMTFPYGLAFGPSGDLYVASSNRVLQYDGTTGNFKGTIGAGILNNAVPLRFGTGGDLFVASYNTDQIFRFDGVTGAGKGVFASGNGLRGPYDMTFGPSGDLYVINFFSNNILRFNGETGSFMGVFASGGGLNEPLGLTFGVGGHLFVSSNKTSQVLRYNGLTGAYIGPYVNLAPSSSVEYLLYVPTAVPEPSSIVLLGGGAITLLLANWKRSRRRVLAAD